MKLNAKKLRLLEEKNQLPKIERRPLYFILDNIYDTYNIGGLFRLAEALAVSKVYICGNSETPPNHKIKKASIGTYKIVPWEYKRTTLDAINDFRKSESQKFRNSEQIKLVSKSDPIIRQSKQASESLNLRPLRPSDQPMVVALEQSKNSIPYTDYNYNWPLALVVGNETHGVSQEVLKACDAIVEIPMYGINVSLNVIVSTAIVGYHVIR
jgi:tRNA G18 (ribose-2'-O)-methylase SpoU